VGDFDGASFKNSNPSDKVLTVDYGDAFYAAIAWRDAPGNKKILLGWLINGRPETWPWKGQMAIPHDLSLKTTSDGLILIQTPSSIISGSLSKYTKGGVLSKKDVNINNESIEFSKEGHFDGNANWIDAEFQINESQNVGFNLVEKKGSSKKVIVGYDAARKELYVDCTSFESGNKSPQNLIQTAPMKPVNGIVKIQILLDKSSLEVFGNDGEKVISTMIYPDTDATGLSAFSNGKAVIKSLKLWDLNRK
jgi:levanase/fructan beta-fructosidase